VAHAPDSAGIAQSLPEGAAQHDAHVFDQVMPTGVGIPLRVNCYVNQSVASYL
jgi:hypothetical protein